MAAHTERVTPPRLPNVILCVFDDPEDYLRSASHHELEAVAESIDHWTQASLHGQLYHGEVLRELQATEDTHVASSLLALCQHAADLPTPAKVPLVFALQLGIYILFAKTYHGKLHDAGSYQSGTNAASFLGYGFGHLLADAAEQSPTLLDLVRNGIAAVRYVIQACQVCDEETLTLSSSRVRGWDRGDVADVRVTATQSARECTLTGDADRLRSLLEGGEGGEGRDHSKDHTPVSAATHLSRPPAGLPRAPPPCPPLYAGATPAAFYAQLQARDLDGHATLASIAQRIHSAPPDGLADAVVGLVDVVTVGAHRTFEAAVVDRLEGVDAHTRSVDLTARLLSSSHAGDIDELPSQYSYIGQTPLSHVAIIGYSLRVPGASDPTEFWDLLAKGRDMHSEIPTHLFELDDYHNPQYRVRNTMRTRHGNFLARPGAFDAAVLGVDADYAKQMDPQHRNAFLAAYEALEMSGYTGQRVDDSTGVFIGGAGDDYREGCSWEIQPGFLAGNSRQSLTANISDFFGFHAPSHTYDTACSSSLVAIEAACQNLVRGRCRSALAGGVSVITQPQVYIGLDRGYFLTRNGHGQCQTFDDGGDGYSRADANAMVHLKLLKDALRDGDEVHGVIEAIGTNHSGKSHSITHPHAPTQARLFDANCRSAAVDPRRVDLVEMHGTGTQAGDANEVGSILGFARGRLRDHPVVIGSVKANLGHSEAASGCVALIKALLCLRHRQAPPHIGIKGRLNAKFPPLDGIVIPTGLQAVGDPHSDMLVCCNNFSAAGGNSSLLLRGLAQRAEERRPSPRLPRCIALSAASSAALEAYCLRLADYLDLHRDLELADVAYTLGVTRCTRFAHRAAYVVASVDELRDALRKPSKQRVASLPAAPAEHGFAFSGQGSQYVGMGRDLYSGNATFRAALDRVRAVLTVQGFPDFCDEIFGLAHAAATPYHWTCGIFAVEYSLWALWESLGVHPAVVVGHSLGEYVALCVAGVLSLPDAVFLVAKRAQLCAAAVREASTASSMLAVHLPRSEVEAALESPWKAHIEVACVNTPTDTVIGGPTDALRHAHAAFKARGIKCAFVEVPFAFHTAAVDPIVAAYREAARRVRFAPPRLPVLSNVLGRTVEAGEDGVFCADYLVRHMRGTVQFADALAEWAGRAGTAVTWIDVSAHPLCAAMIAGCTSTQSKGRDGVGALMQAVATLHLAGDQLDLRPLFASAHKVELPWYAWQYDDYWIRYTDRALSTALLEARAHAPTTTSTGFAMLTERLSLPGETTTRYRIDLTKSPVRDVVEGHLVHGVSLVPASMYSDVALQAGLDVMEARGQSFDAARHAWRVSALVMDEPVILGIHDEVFLTAEGDPQGSAGMQLGFAYANGKHQGSCVVSCVDHASVSAGFAAAEGILARRITALARHDEPASATLSTDLIYRLFTKVVDYSPMYRAMQAMHLNADEDEAVIDVTFQPAPHTSTHRWVVYPAYQDSMGQCTGFLPNLQADADHVYVANGCDTIEYLAEAADVARGGRHVRVHCAMREEQGLATSDAFFFDVETGKIVGHMGGVRFRKIPLRVMKRLLPKPAAAHQPTRAGERGERGEPSNAPPDAARALPSPPGPGAPNPPASPPARGPLFDQLCSVMTTELGVAQSELTSDRAVADLGLDSLMSLGILGALQEAHNVELPASLFMDYPTVGALQAYCAQAAASGGSSSSSSGTSTPTDTSRSTRVSTESPDVSEGASEASFGSLPLHTAVKVLRASESTRPPLLLMPEGTGSPQVYSHLVAAGFGDRLVLGAQFESTRPGWTLEELASGLLKDAAQVLGRRPCIVAGWSLGGLLAHMAAASSTLNVVGLVAIDTPPMPLEPLPRVLIDYIGARSPQRRTNVEASVDAAMQWQGTTTALQVPVLTVRGLAATELPGVAHCDHWVVRGKKRGSDAGRQRNEGPQTVDIAEASHFSILDARHAASVAGAMCSFLDSL
ncbi:unnamed protein product [Parajaminaea phylloscopi]